MTTQDITKITAVYHNWQQKSWQDTYSDIPEFLMISSKRDAFDHLAWYWCDSNVRGGLDWNRFCDIDIPLPAINVQKKYVAIYRFLEKKSLLDEKLKEATRPLCPILI